MNLMDKNKGQCQTSEGHKRSRSQIVKSIENSVLLHVSRHACRYFIRKVIKVKVMELLKLEALLFD